MFGDVGDGFLDDVVWVVFQLPKNQRVAEGLGQALVVDDRAKYA